MPISLLRRPVRRLTQAPGFVLAVVCTLALSIGANTAVFSLVNALLLRPLPYPQPQRLAAIEIASSHGNPDETASIDGETWEQIRDQVPAVAAAVSSIGGPRTTANIRTPEGVRSVSTARVSAEFFNVLGQPPALGRSFKAEEDREGGPHAVILSNRLWKTALQSNPAALGESILLKGEPYTIVGVTNERVSLPGAAEIYTPIRPSRTGEGGGTNYGLIARLKPGASWQDANVQLGRLQPAFLRDGLRPGEHRTLRFVPLQQSYSAAERDPALALLLATGLILLIACANLASLTLVRLRRRSYELATRLALGATHARLLCETWQECALLAILGGTAGVATAVGLLRALVALLPVEAVPFGGASLDVRVLVFSLMTSLATSLLFGMIPAFAILRIDPAAVLGRRTIAGSRNRARQWLIAGEVALTVVLLAGSGLLLRSLIHLQKLPPGFDPHGVLTAQASLDQANYRDPLRIAALLRDSVAAMERIPGITQAAVGLSLPYERSLNTGITIKDGKQAGSPAGTDEVYVTPHYFGALGMRLREGRSFTAGDTAKSEPVAIVDESFARQILHDAHPVGRRIARVIGSNQQTLRIVGVVEDVQRTPGLGAAGPLSTERTLYAPYTQADAPYTQADAPSLTLMHTWFQPSWILRSTRLDAQTPAAMQRALSSVDPNLPFASFRTMGDLLATALAQQRIEVALLTTLAALAILLAALGIFALVSAIVTERRREFGIRLALGSTFSESILLAFRAGVLPSVAGLAGGLALAALALRAMRRALFGVSSLDPLVLGATAATLLLLAALASLLPALRVARIQPAEVLRTE